MKALWHLPVALVFYVALSGPVQAGDLGGVDRGVDIFFKMMKEGGLDGIETAVRQSYKAYDLKPSLEDLQPIVGVDLAAYLFYENLGEGVKKNMPHYDLWESDSVIARVDRRLANHIKGKPKREEVMLLWLRSVKSKMHLHYLSEQSK
jgi:hypothetical protein